jgi:hypothetical protein
LALNRLLTKNKIFFKDSLDLSAAGGGGASPAYLRSSLPDMSKPVKIYPLEHLLTTNKQLPEDVFF